MYDIVLFDLDGTLTDPGEGITNSVAYALNKFNIKVKDKTELYNFIGPPLIDSFMKYYDMSYEDGLKAVDYFQSDKYLINDDTENYFLETLTDRLIGAIDTRLIVSKADYDKAIADPNKKTLKLDQNVVHPTFTDVDENNNQQ